MGERHFKGRGGGGYSGKTFHPSIPKEKQQIPTKMGKKNREGKDPILKGGGGKHPFLN